MQPVDARTIVFVGQRRSCPSQRVTSHVAVTVAHAARHRCRSKIRRHNQPRSSKLQAPWSSVQPGKMQDPSSQPARSIVVASTSVRAAWEHARTVVNGGSRVVVARSSVHASSACEVFTARPSTALPVTITSMEPSEPSTAKEWIRCLNGVVSDGHDSAVPSVTVRIGNLRWCRNPGAKLSIVPSNGAP